jgi:hypothetical protein
MLKHSSVDGVEQEETKETERKPFLRSLLPLLSPVKRADATLKGIRNLGRLLFNSELAQLCFHVRVVGFETQGFAQMHDRFVAPAKLQ